MVGMVGWFVQAKSTVHSRVVGLTTCTGERECDLGYMNTIIINVVLQSPCVA